MPRFVRARARFVDAATRKPLAGPNLRAELRDFDLLQDDFLGHGHFVGLGMVEVLFSLSDAASADSPGEEHPDLYLVLWDGPREIFRTPVKFNVVIPRQELLTAQGAPTVDLGEFLVPTPK